MTVKISSILQRQKIPEGIRIYLENHSSSTGNSKKTHLSQPKTFKKKQKIEKKIIFRKNFQLKVSGKSHSAENLEQFFMLAKRFVSSKN